MNDQKPLVDLNTASIDELTTLPGIGPALAERIMAARPFASPGELQKVSGIGSSVIENLASYITVYAEQPEPVVLDPVQQASEQTAEAAGDAREMPDQAQAIEIPEAENVQTAFISENNGKEAMEILAAEPAEPEMKLETAAPPPEEPGDIPGEEIEETETPLEEAPIEEPYIPAAVAVYPSGEEWPQSVQPELAAEETSASQEFDKTPETPPGPRIEAEAAQAEPATQSTSAQSVSAGQDAARQTAARQNAARQNTASRTDVFWIAIGSGVIAFILAVALSLGLLVAINGGLQFVNPAQFVVLNNQVNGLNAQANTLQQDVDGLRTRLDNLEALSGRVNTLEQDTQQLRGDVDSAASQLNTVDQQVQDLSGQVTGLTSDVKDLQTQTGRFQSFLDGLRELLTNLVQP